MTSSSLLEGKVAIVAGGSGGIGAATSRRLAAEGARIVVGYRSSRDNAEAICAALPGEGHLPLAVTIEDSTSIAGFRDAVLEATGRADILVNTAGMTVPVAHDDLDALTDELIDEVFANNWRGVFATIRAFRPALAATGDGLVVNVSSIAAFTAIGSSIAYCSAKAGLDIMSEALARALAPEIRVVAVSPGVVDTRFVPGRDAAFNAKVAQSTPLGRVTTPDDVAAAIAACATHLRFTTGSRIVVDGGRHL
ncbi:MAG: SDR family oxidoreductase [Pseudomonadota bacterium]